MNKVIITAPSRISLFGGSGDTPEYSQVYGAIVLSMAINIRQHIIIETPSDGLSVFNSPDNIFIKNILASYGYQKTIKITSEFDSIIGSGLGSSSSEVVGIIGGLNKLLGRSTDLPELCEKSYQIESGIHDTGRQDIYASAYGGVNVLEIKDKVMVTPLGKPFIEPLLPYLVLFDTKITRQPYKASKLSPQQIAVLDTTKELTLEAIEALSKGEIKRVGELLAVSWRMKSALSNKMSNDQIDTLYENLLKNGAYGGKLLGSGGGGMFLAIVPPEIRQEFLLKTEIEEIDFSVDWNGIEVRRV